MRQGGRRRALGLTVAIVVLALGGVVGLDRHREAIAQSPSSRVLTGDAVIAAFRAAGLAVEDPRPQSRASSPSGPPATEQEAIEFRIPGVEGGGRIYVFADTEKLNKKAAWFRRSGATVITVSNVIVWLDPALPADVAARYRQALQGLR